MVGDLVDTIMKRGDRVPISLFIATHSVNTQMWEVLATLRLRGRPARDGCQVHCETVLGDAFSTSPQICSPKQSHNALWQLSRPGLPRNFKVANRPLPTFKKPHFQNKAKCTTFLVEMSFIYMRMKTHFHIKGWALNLVLIQRPRGTRKWPIASQKISRATWKPDHCLWILFFVFLQPQRICLWVLFPTITSDRDSGECLCQIPFFDVHSNTFLLGWCLLPP